ncbi:hypothetical protein D6633_08160 [Campylobacter coli]|nr:hypothetical protein [Campylobacter coli]EAH5118095.1 hypothetical protein [Campylobacter coli]
MFKFFITYFSKICYNYLMKIEYVSLDVLKAYVQNQGIEDNRVKKQYNSKHKRLKEQELCK